MATKQQKIESAVVSISESVGQLTGTFSASEAKLLRIVEDNDEQKALRKTTAEAVALREQENAAWWAKFRREITPQNVMIGTGLVIVLVGFLKGELTVAEALEATTSVKIVPEAPAPTAPVSGVPGDDQP